MTNGKVLYVAGPYRSEKGMWGVHENIHRAKQIAQKLWAMGYAVICPHANTAFMDGSDIPDHHFLAGDLLIIRKVDGVVMAPGWKESVGSTAEYEYAKNLSIPIFEWDLWEWNHRMEADVWTDRDRLDRWAKQVV